MVDNLRKEDRGNGNNYEEREKTGRVQGDVKRRDR